MNIVKNIFFLTTIVTVLSTAECDNRSKIQRFQRNGTSIRVKRTSFSPSFHLPYDYSDNADGFYVLDLHLISQYCSFDERNCNPNHQKWIISDFKFQLNNNKDPCHNITVDFDPQKISSIQSIIDEMWARDENWKFLELTGITWKFSGSCSLRIPELNDELKFFKKSIDLYGRFNITKILQDKGMTIGGDYSIEKISDAMSDVLGGKHAQLGCLKGKNWWNYPNFARFNEVIIFLDKQFNPINNPGWRKIVNGIQECQQNTTVHYGV